MAREFRDLGCDAHATRLGVVAVDASAVVPVDVVMDALGRGKDAGRWDCEIGVSPPPGTEERASGEE